MPPWYVPLHCAVVSALIQCKVLLLWSSVQLLTERELLVHLQMGGGLTPLPEWSHVATKGSASSSCLLRYGTG